MKRGADEAQAQVVNVDESVDNVCQFCTERCDFVLPVRTANKIDTPYDAGERKRK